ncbi:uncharacterized protein LOC121738346 isoform X2 [Aricia agestis]|uniref:uncharacterized protein LOC121738346 isoform X2 n=1 Tax=Aricia agestis TaxID=91739 RepID=UPI001C20A514|nr:uncharacterized protein LOC121738346 isoform X2 [Aricia agestis]
MSAGSVRSARSSPAPDACPDCDAGASVTDLHKYQVACNCKPASVQYACADDPGPPPPAKTDTPPALPPRPPTSVLATNRRNNASVGCNSEPMCRRRKYAWWCCGCGALAAALGGLLAAQHILLRAYTASPQHLETVPAAVPAAMLVLTGVCIMSLARRRNRYSYMIKVVGACCLVCALTCVLVTITTTVIHMNKLQTLKFCEYTKLTRTCTCYSMPPDTQHAADDEGVRCVFEGVSECGVVHGALYWCLRGVFALSVCAVLVCICSCMLAYQLLSHERKKMYWEQLELRCRSLYRAPSAQPVGTAPRPTQPNCSCCAQCHPAQPAWDFSLQHRFWAPGRIGNLYSPNPGTGRKTSPWSWFPWPRGNSQNSRCRMNGVPQSGDSAYGFCENDTPNPTQPYDERTYPANFQFPRQNPNFQPANFQPANFQPANFPPNLQSSGNFQGQFPQSASFASSSQFSQAGYQEGFGEASGSFDAQTGVWGPPPPYSPQGRNGSRHHLHQDPAAATLLHHHHIDVHRTHDHQPLPQTHAQSHACRNSYHPNPQNIEHAEIGMNPETARLNPELARLNPELARLNPDLARLNPELARLNPELARLNPDLARINPELARLNPEIARINPELARLNPDLVRLNPELARLNPELARLNPEIARLNPELALMSPELARLNTEMGHLQMYPDEAHLAQERFNTLRGHLVPYRGCARPQRDSRDVTIECVHQKSASKVSDQSSECCQKQGKENLGFQNDKHSPIRSSMHDCHRNHNAESEVYFADVSSCCNVSVKADCCMNPNVSALVGTIENHPESTSESDTGSFTLTRQQRPQPQVSSKRRPRQTDKHVKTVEKMRQDINSSIRLTEQQIDQLNSSMRERLNESRISERMNDSRDRLNGSRDRLNDPRDRLNESRDRINEVRMNERERLNESIVERMNDSRDRLNDSRIERISERSLNDSRIERLNDSRIERDRISDSRSERDRNNDSRNDRERLNDSRLERERLNDSRIERDRLNDSRIERDRMNDSRIEKDRLNDSRIERDRLNDSRIERDRLNDSRIERERLNDSRSDRDSRLDRSERFEDRRMSDLNSSIRVEGSPKLRSPLRIPKSSPKNLPKEHPRQSSSDSGKPEFFVPPPPISPLSPNTEESLLSDEDGRPEAKCLGPDSQYEGPREVIKGHHHCYSDTNTMDSGWQSGSERHVTD